MNCQEAQSNVLNYINHKLNKEEIRRFIEHIRECDDCRDELEIYYITMQQIDDGELQTADFQKALKEDMCTRYEQCMREQDRTHSIRVLLGAFILSLLLWLIGQLIVII